MLTLLGQSYSCSSSLLSENRFDILCDVFSFSPGVDSCYK